MRPVPRQVPASHPATCKKLSLALELVGDAATLFIVDSLSHGEARFCALQRAADNMNPVTLTRRLKKLEQLAIVERREETVDKLSVSYRLTQRGRGLLPLLRDIKQYAKRYLA
jgi:DNA-binding HxlR family transcriptional regulator